MDFNLFEYLFSETIKLVLVPAKKMFFEFQCCGRYRRMGSNRNEFDSIIFRFHPPAWNKILFEFHNDDLIVNKIFF